ncbi:MAG: 50S ribosomal protein L4 [Candidatus Nanoarchaeia archaeon]
MKADVYSLDGKKTKSVDLPEQFDEEVRTDLIKRAFFALISHNRQRHGTLYEAGTRNSAKLSRRRHDYKGAYGMGMSRAPRKTMWRRGTQFGWVGAFAPYAVGGRKAHPPKAEKIFDEKINKKERRKAIRSALAGSKPYIIENKFEDLQKTKEVYNVFKNLKLENELERCEERKTRAGKGKLRGRRYITKKGPLIVVANENCKLLKSALNLPGLDITFVRNLNVELLAPGANPGRLTLYTENAVDELKANKLFTNNTIPVKEIPKEIKKEVKPIKKVEKKVEKKKVTKK